MHAILESILVGNSEHGMALYALLDRPTGTDERWMGYCLFLQGQLLPARDLLFHAKAKQAAAAAIELATVLRHLGAPAEAHLELLSLNDHTLEPMDQVLVARERGALALYEGRLDLAQKELECAWRLTQNMVEAGQPLIGFVAQLLGHVYSLVGKPAWASHYVTLSLTATTGAKRLHPLMTCAQMEIYAGEYLTAADHLDEAASLLNQLPGAHPYHSYLRGLLHRSQGRFGAAVLAFGQAAQVASESGESSTEFIAELDLAASLTAQRELSRAEAHLLRAQSLAASTWELGMLDLRYGFWHSSCGDAAALTWLLRARDTFTLLHLPRELAWVELHLAENQAENAAMALAAIKRAIHHGQGLTCLTALLPELPLLPEVSRLLGQWHSDPDIAAFLDTRSKVISDMPLNIQLITLGGEALLADGHPLRLGMRRTCELLAFLLIHGAATRDQILVNLWPDDDPRRSANYFHQAVHQLITATPHLKIQYDRLSHQYTISCEGPALHWDMERFRSALESNNLGRVLNALETYAGPFLPNAGSTWASVEREVLENQVIAVGLNMLANWKDIDDPVQYRALTIYLSRFSH